ncbi:MAG: DUF3256 family protein [Muribaculaceae bacterium]|nr:DUF3256 family protein [Muribaculaceae bacterium]
MKFSIKRKNKSLSLLLMALVASTFTTAAKAETTGSDTVKRDTEQTKTENPLTARSVFEKINCSGLEILPPSTRLDMLDYWDVDSIYKASNAMEGLSFLRNVSPSYLKVEVTPVSVFEIKILPDKKGPLIMTIYTVGDDVQAQDSQIKFYNEALEELPTEKYFKMPEVKDFFEIPKGSATKMKEIENMIPFPTIALEANPDNTDLKARLTVEKYINEDDWNIAKLFLRPPLTFHWVKSRFKL